MNRTALFHLENALTILNTSPVDLPQARVHLTSAIAQLKQKEEENR